MAVRSRFTSWMPVVIFLFLRFILVYSAWNTRGAVQLSEIRTRHKNIGIENSDFSIYCYAGGEKTFSTVWRTVYFRVLNIAPEEYELFYGYDVDNVKQEYDKAAQSWFQLLPWRSEALRLLQFNNSCVGVRANHDYVAALEIKRTDFWKIAQLVIGLSLFYFASKLSHNVLFHYSTGVALGLTTSILLIIFILSRYVPKKSGALSVLLGGWAVVLYFLQKLWLNMFGVLQNYSNYVVGYLVIVGILSFAICYRYGPVENPRTLNLIKWGLQAVGLLLVYLSSEWQELSMSIVLGILAIHNLPRSLIAFLVRIWRRRFPPRIKLLTEDEYYDEASRETRKALQQLQEYCRSPDCDAWKLTTRLSSPKRFANFVSGNSHLSDDEIIEYQSYNTSIPQFNFDDFTDDDSD